MSAETKIESWKYFPGKSALLMECARALLLSPVQLFAPLWTVACQAPLSMGFSLQEY